MTPAKYLVIGYLFGALVTLGRTVFATVDATTCLESVDPCVTAVRALAWTGLDWPLYWGLRFAGPESESVHLPSGLIPMAVLSCAAAMAGLGMMRSERKPIAARREAEPVGRAAENREATPAPEFACGGETGGRRDQGLPSISDPSGAARSDESVRPARSMATTKANPGR